MNRDDAAAILTVLESAWPTYRWREDQEHYWLDLLMSYDVVEAGTAIRALVMSIPRPPSEHEFWEAICAVRRREEIRQQEARAALPVAPPSPSERENRRRWVAALREVKAGMNREEHDHRPGHACVVCAPHDHSDQRVFGYSLTAHYAERPDSTGQYRSTIVREVVLADRFTCPRCGDPQTAQYLVADWTGEGIAFMKAQGITVTGGAR